MLRTYGRRALQRRSDVQSKSSDHHESVDPPVNISSTPRKRQKVYVEIVSPKRKESSTLAQSPPSASSDTQKLKVGDSKSLEAASRGSPKTPERSSKDQSSIFSNPSYRLRTDSPSKRGNVVKSMLGRSKTESSLQETPPAAASMLRQASWHPPPTTFQEGETSLEASSQSPPKSLPARSIRTYAGPSRSFLVPLSAPETDPSNTAEDDTEPHESYTDLRNRWGIDISEDDLQHYPDGHTSIPTPLKPNGSETSRLSLPVGMMNDLKSITELRSKGEGRRFLDEVGYLFEGLDGSAAIALRRASAFEIVNKLCDVDFNRRAKTSDFYIRTWDKLYAARVGTNDKIFDATIAFFAALAARDPHTLTEVAQQDNFIPTLVGILGSIDHKKDVLGSDLVCGSDETLKLHGILRTDITALKSLARLVSKESYIVTSSTQPSIRLFISHSLATLPSFLLSDQYLATLLMSLRAELTLLESRIAAHRSGLPLLPTTGVDRSDIPSLYHIEACLRLLDSYLLGHWSTADDDSSSGLSPDSGLASELISLCIASSVISEEGEREIVIARMCLCGALRVLTLLSHDDSWWCSSTLEVSDALPFVTKTVIQYQARWSETRNTETQDSPVEAFDVLCLTLGLMMNWAAFSPQVANLSRVKLLDPMCPGFGICVRACQCPYRKSVLECIASLYGRYSGDQQDSSLEYAFLRGYIAILLGLLIKDDASNQAIVISTLPGISLSERIRSLIMHCHSFLDFYDNTPSLSSDPSHVVSEEADKEYFGCNQMSWDRKDKQIAQSVVTFLVSLHDTL